MEKKCNLFSQGVVSNILEDISTMIWKFRTQERASSEDYRDTQHLPLDARKQLMIYLHYLLSKISWDLTMADLDVIWVKNTQDNLCHNHKVIYGSMTQGLSLTILRKKNSGSMNINFRINPNVAINSYVVNVYKHSQSTMKERNTWDNTMLQVHSQNIVC